MDFDQSIEDMAKAALEPIASAMIDQLIDNKGLPWLDNLLPLEVSVTFVVRSGNEHLATITATSTVSSFDILN